MSTPTHDVVEALVHALNHGDLPEILDAFTDDAVFSSDGGIASGRRELAALFDGTLEEPRPRMILRHVEQDGNVLHCRATRRFTISDGEQAIGHDVEIRCVFTVVAGAVSRVVVDPIQ